LPDASSDNGFAVGSDELSPICIRLLHFGHRLSFLPAARES
jgi:hypothetical protein